MISLVALNGCSMAFTLRCHQTWLAGKWIIYKCDFPMKTSIDRVFFLAMFDYQRVRVFTIEKLVASCTCSHWTNLRVGPFEGKGWSIFHTWSIWDWLHVWYIYLHPKNGPNVGKYSIHGASGFGIVSNISCCVDYQRWTMEWHYVGISILILEWVFMETIQYRYPLSFV